MHKKAITLIITGFLLLLVLWFVRPLGIIHGTVMYFYKYPLIWMLPLLTLALIVLITFVVTRGHKDKERESSYYYRAKGPWDIAAITALFLVPTAFFLAMLIAPVLTGQAIYNTYKPDTIASLPASGETRILPKEVAEVLARNGFSSPTETLENAHIIRTDEGLTWTFGQSPDGLFRRISKKTQGSATLPADKTSRNLGFQNQEFKIGPGHLWSDSVTWRAYKKHYFTEVAESIYLPEAGKILVPYIGYKGFFVKTPYLAGAYLISPSGEIEDLSPEEAMKEQEIKESGRLFPESLARRIQDSYKYVHGIWNRFFTHRDVLTIEDSAGNNIQPHYLDIKDQPTWVSVAEPWGRSDAIGGVFFTDALSGETSLWRPEKNAGLTSSRKAVDATKALAIPGISFRAGDFRAIEPRPIFRDGQVRFLVSIIPGTRSTVSKSVIIDPKSNRALEIFSHNSDPLADEKLAAYLAGENVSGDLPRDDSANNNPRENKAADPSAIIEELLQENERMRQRLEELLKEYNKTPPS